MADRSAAVLAELLLAADEPGRAESLERALAGDPPLVFWAVCVADRDGLKPRSIGHLADWLAKHALEVLKWNSKRDGPFDATDTPEAQQLADRVAAALEVAQLAATFSKPDGQQLAEEAHLLGLLENAAGWPSLGKAAVGKAARRCLPKWLLGNDQTGAARRVAEAVEALAGSNDTARDDVQNCRRHAAEARRRWLESVEGLGARLPELAARLSRLADLENRFQQSLETEKLAAMAELAAGAGHEINNPLAVIAGRAQLLLQDETEPERRRELALISAQAKRVYEMIADMRLFARPPQPSPEPTDLVALVDQVVADLGPQAAERATSLVRTGASDPVMIDPVMIDPVMIDPVMIDLDPTQLQVALRALCKNSLEAIGHDGQIQIAVRDGDQQAEIRVSDDGPGIPPEVRRHLFDPFYSAREAGRGLGLGLSKCWRIVVTNHGGRIDVQSQPEKRTVFTITLPKRWGQENRSGHVPRKR